MVSDKLSSVLAFDKKVALHVTRGVRWDSDHVVLFDDETKEICKEVVRCGIDKVFIALDYFDASINRISAWVTGMRSIEKALLFALLQPNEKMKELQDSEDFTALMVLSEEAKLLPFSDVWEEYLKRENVPSDYLTAIRKYESDVLSKRN